MSPLLFIFHFCISLLTSRERNGNEKRDRTIAHILKMIRIKIKVLREKKKKVCKKVEEAEEEVDKKK